MRFILRGKRSIWWGVKLLPVWLHCMFGSTAHHTKKFLSTRSFWQWQQQFGSTTCLAPPHIIPRSSCQQEGSGSGSNTDFILGVAAFLDIGLRVFACSMTWNRMTCNVLYQYSKSSQTFVALDMRQPWIKRFRCSAVRVPLWAAHCLRRIRMSQNAVSLQLARRCGPHVAVVSHPNSEECRFSAVRAPLWATHWFRCIRMPKNMSMTLLRCPKKRLLAKTTEKEGIRAGDCFFSIGQRVLIGLCFFIEWKLPPPACPGTTGILN